MEGRKEAKKGGAGKEEKIDGREGQKEQKTERKEERGKSIKVAGGVR